MAYDKAVDSSRLDGALGATAEALRGKGAEGVIPWDADTGFKAAVDGLPSGGGYSEEMLIGMFNRTATEIILPEGVQRIPNGLCYRDFDLKSVQLPSTILYFGSDCFRDCRVLELSELPPNVVELAATCFSGARAITVSEIPASVQTIAIDAFSGCTAMTEVTFCGTPTSVHTRAFNGDTWITTIRVPWAEGEVANAPWGATNANIIYGYTGE